ncbi:MAG TPA: NADH-quinone oxidoreductase subunit N [Chloroflexi bacterium]|nr:NADH-quinone oxidoreductase subunit N [Chloroflexota bacterium]
MSINDFLAILPVLVVLVTGVLVMVADVFLPEGRKGIAALLSGLGLAAGLGAALAAVPSTGTAFAGMVVADGFSLFLDALFAAVGLVGIGLAYDYFKRMRLQRGEYYTLLLFSIGGMMLMGHANDLVMFFLALELLSIPLYILSGFFRARLASQEAALKYFLLGAFSSGFVLYGIAMVFGGTASINLEGIVAAVRDGSANLTFLLVGAALLVVGFAFKVSAVPFHAWTPDVYEGAPSPLTGFMSSATKAAGFAALIRLLLVVFPALGENLAPVVSGLAALTMIAGNLIALVQTNIKRLLAYSSIAHAGYLLIGLVAVNSSAAGDAVAAMLFYLVGYAIANLGAWSVVVAAEQAEGRGLELEDYSGLGRKYPWLGVAMLVFMLSFIGVPLTLGFWGKLYLFRVALESGLFGLAVIGIAASLVSAYYYLRVVVYMFFRDGEGVARRDVWLNLIAIGSAAAVVLMALVPGDLLQVAAQAVLRVP